ncbi:PQQ-binding-like beta-propeller repeat protein [Streptomyces sp. NBC_00075]|uniref:serine/threonine-protein kinase n=1 Tax=Streptomyces sp. NBC_00075 TaxID=2975641 RepID=UPI00325469C8
MLLHKEDPKSVGGYKLVDRLGSGGMGIVYRGRSRSGREVAVKVVHAQYAEDKVFRARFRQEIESVRKVSGAFTAPVVDADPEAVRPWMATQYVPGRSLADRIREGGALRPAELRQLALGLVEALRDIHRAGVVHRDLKPANVLLADDGPRVIDFGISRAAENHQTLTETGQMIGTPPFMSPEQFTDARKVGPASDVFSLGALLVFSATGRGPFDADSPYMTAFRVVHESPELDGVPQPLRAVLERCLTKEAADRPGLDALALEFAAVLPEPDPGDPGTVTLRRDVLRTIEETHAGGADPAAPTRAAARRARGRRGRRVRPVLATVCTLGVLVLGTGWYIRFGPGFADDSSVSTAPVAGSRWSAAPRGWQPWQTTVLETAQRGEVNPLGTENGNRGDSTCQRYEDAVYCAGSSILPVRLDALTGATVWRSSLATAAEGGGGGRNDFALLGVRDGAMLVRYAAYADENSVDATTRVIALDTESGDELWSREVNDTNIEAALTGDLVMTTDAEGRLVTARSPRTGSDRWTTQLPAGTYCTFTTVGTGLYAHCLPMTDDPRTAEILRLDLSDGSVVQRFKVPYQTVLLGAAGGKLVVLAAGTDGQASAEDGTSGTFLLVDPDTGASTTTTPAKPYTGSVTLAADTLWITGADGQVSAVSPLTGEQLWTTRTGVEHSGPPTYDAGTRTVYAASPSGRVAALDAAKGTLLWETPARVEQVTNGDAIKPAVLPYGGALIAATPDGTVFSLDPAHPERKPVSG